MPAVDAGEAGDRGAALHIELGSMLRCISGKRLGAYRALIGRLLAGLWALIEPALRAVSWRERCRFEAQTPDSGTGRRRA
jgi:hypothetical protein